MSEIGLCLGGGGAKGLAHIGVLKYLEETNITISEVSGTSMEAIVGALHAFGKSSKDMQEILDNFKYRKHIDISLKLGLLSGNKIQSYLHELFDGKTIGDANIPLTICATDIDSGEEYVFSPDTPVGLALRASFGIPGVFCPVEWDGHKLVDGGLVNNLPVDHLSAKHRIASSVISYRYPICEGTVLFGFFRKKTAFFTITKEYLNKSYAILQSKVEEFTLSKLADGIRVDHLRTDPSIRFHDFAASSVAIYHGYHTAKEYFEMNPLTKIDS